MMRPRYSTDLCSNLHFSGLRKSQWDHKVSRISLVTLQCSSRVGVKIKMSFIMVWNVAGELHKPKNMTKGSKSPQLVIKATFHSSPLLTLTLLKPHQRSRVENHLAL